MTAEQTKLDNGGNHRTKHRLRRALPYAGAGLLVALIVIGLWPQPIRVELAAALAGRLRVTVDEEGKTRIRQRYVVSAPVSGQLQRIELKPGAEVEAGRTVLAVIDPVAPALLDARTRSLAEQRRDAATANLAKARAAHAQAASERQRFEKLFTEKTVSIQELETIQLKATAAAQDEAAAESALRLAEAELAEFDKSTPGGAAATRPPVELKAPVSGRILRVHQESSRVVPAGAPLVEIGNPADLEVVIEVLSRDGAQISPGTPVELEQWGGGEPLAAQVRLVEPAAFTKVSALGVEEQRVNVVADLLTPPEKRAQLGDQFRVDARIIVWQAEQALRVPAGSVFRQGSQWAVFVHARGVAELRPVQVGRSNGTETQIVGGLKEGEEVILYPGDRIRPGQRIQIFKI